MYDKRLAVIITASVIPSHPDIRIIKNTIESLNLINLSHKSLIILAHDACNEIKMIDKYDEYIANLNKFIESRKDFKRFRICLRENHGHLVGNVRNAIDFLKRKIDPEFVLVMQHDLPFSRPFDVQKIIDDMKNPLGSPLKHVRFPKRKIGCHHCDAIYPEVYGKIIKCNNYKYTSTGAWSDNNHISPMSYYENIIMKECPDGTAMELVVGKNVSNWDQHKKYGTYLFGVEKDLPWIHHLDGRKSK